MFFLHHVHPYIILYTLQMALFLFFQMIPKINKFLDFKKFIIFLWSNTFYGYSRHAWYK